MNWNEITSNQNLFQIEKNLLSQKVMKNTSLHCWHFLLLWIFSKKKMKCSVFYFSFTCFLFQYFKNCIWMFILDSTFNSRGQIQAPKYYILRNNFVYLVTRRLLKSIFKNNRSLCSRCKNINSKLFDLCLMLLTFLDSLRRQKVLCFIP